MEIKTLVDYTQTLKKQRNALEVVICEINDEYEKDKDNKDRMGLEFSTDIITLFDATYNLKNVLSNLNEGIAHLESTYRRSVRFKKSY